MKAAPLRTVAAVSTVHARPLRESFIAAFNAVEDEARAIGINTGPNTRFDGLWDRLCAYIAHEALQARKFELGLRTALASPSISDDERLFVFDVMHGHSDPPRRVPEISEHEERLLIRLYRSSDPDSRAVMRTVLGRLRKPADGTSVLRMERRTRGASS